MKSLVLTICLIFSQVLLAGTRLPTEKNVDIGRYIGKWYAVLSLPQYFTRSCVAQTADYALVGEKTISVLNTCIKANGKTKTIDGKAVVTNPVTNAELVVTFNNFWTRLFRVKGEYIIVKLSEGYDTVLVGTNDRKSLWIMSRTPGIEEKTELEFVTTAKSLGFNTSKLIRSQF